VLNNWKSVIRAVALASTSLAKYKEEDYDQKEGVDPPLPETLVRIRLNND
jgi:hypothetical protein